MKRLMYFLPVLLFMVACNDSATKETGSKDSTTTASADSMKYPYTIKNPDAWVPGDKQHTLNSLKALKAFENGNIDECVSYFADSVRLRFDEMDEKVSNDTLKAWFTKWRGAYSSMHIDMGDWESVKSSATGEEYVSLWYKQVNETKDGKKDSLSVMDDLKIEKGKIVELDEKSRKFPKKKM